jgi:hypothetical protein
MGIFSFVLSTLESRWLTPKKKLRPHLIYSRTLLYPFFSLSLQEFRPTQAP